MRRFPPLALWRWHSHLHPSALLLETDLADRRKILQEKTHTKDDLTLPHHAFYPCWSLFRTKKHPRLHFLRSCHLLKTFLHTSPSQLDPCQPSRPKELPFFFWGKRCIAFPSTLFPLHISFVLPFLFFLFHASPYRPSSPAHHTRLRYNDVNRSLLIRRLYDPNSTFLLCSSSFGLPHSKGNTDGSNSEAKQSF